MSNARQRQPSDAPNLPKAPGGSPTQAFTGPKTESVVAAETEQLVPFSTYTTPEIRQRLRILAVTTGRKQHVLVTEALREYLERHES